MESIETELCVDRSKSDRQGRRIRSAEEWAQILERYDSSGLTQEAFCRCEGIRYGTLVAWLGRRRKHGGDLRGLKPSPRKFHELALSGDGSGPSEHRLEVRLPDGTSVCGSSAADLAQLIRLLRD
ncbi:hypothetical protein QEH59_18540 [Coraliomargarita sp. SDUM461004]|uniref:Transposase n=1 Tax=Thalassobacterium sedimentorum TaxID=3041258 RepID=A0ABU1ANR0_9BACT|nr:hypothetical protein [Coraliomargarita sp. SDUM461004]MDQ8196434.1 hypothetical protein [Coraliomargarita sp. SDUM461004]